MGIDVRSLTPFIIAATLAAGRASPEVAAERDRARADAEEAIAAGRPHLLYIGLPGPHSSPLDTTTGLPSYSMGCVVSDGTLAYMKSFNAATLAARDAGRLEGMTFEGKVTTAEALRARFGPEGGRTLTLGGPAADAPGGAFRVEIAPRSGREGDTPYLFVTEVATGRRKELVYVGEPRARVLFDHDGTTLLARDDRYRVFRTFDLPRALELQVFPDP